MKTDGFSLVVAIGFAEIKMGDTPRIRMAGMKTEVNNNETPAQKKPGRS